MNKFYLIKASCLLLFATFFGPIFGAKNKGGTRHIIIGTGGGG